MTWNRISKRVADILQNKYTGAVEGNLSNNNIIDIENILGKMGDNYISPNEIFILAYYGNINRNDLVSKMFKYKLMTTYLGIYVLSMYEFWAENEYILTKHIPGKTYTIAFDDFDGKYGGKIYMYGTFDNYIVMKRIFMNGNLIITMNKPYFGKNDRSKSMPKYAKNDHDNPIVHPKKNKKNGMYISESNYVRLYNGPIEKYIEFDYLLFHNNLQDDM